MAAFTFDKEKLALLVDCLNVGMDGAQTTSFEDSDAIASLIAELDAIAEAGGSAEITVMRD